MRRLLLLLQFNGSFLFMSCFQIIWFILFLLIYLFISEPRQFPPVSVIYPTLPTSPSPKRSEIPPPQTINFCLVFFLFDSVSRQFLLLLMNNGWRFTNIIRSIMHFDGRVNLKRYLTPVHRQIQNGLRKKRSAARNIPLFIMQFRKEVILH